MLLHGAYCCVYLTISGKEGTAGKGDSDSHSGDNQSVENKKMIITRPVVAAVADDPNKKDKKADPSKNELITNAASAVTMGTDALVFSIYKAAVISKIALGVRFRGTSLKCFTRSGTVIGAIAGDGPAIARIKITKKITASDGIAVALTVDGGLSEFTGIGEFYEGTVGLLIAAGSLTYDIIDAVCSKN